VQLALVAIAYRSLVASFTPVRFEHCSHNHLIKVVAQKEDMILAQSKDRMLHTNTILKGFSIDFSNFSNMRQLLLLAITHHSRTMNRVRSRTYASQVILKSDVA
jgi:hypothetical protein